MAIALPLPERPLSMGRCSSASVCREAVLIVQEARSIAGLEVTVVNLDAPGQRVPLQVFATPTYILDGLVVSLGNPA
ncbi:hypothetical protein KSC_111180 [Ktedonobacter sp. SOSP1-52]|uniref:hypothetical protein n=1 Tax=Ktedonobacter sp. SOSP1-52 TaxID=2778366 RepID=UPI0019169148|nr:hypothetical protein [Ktedonobacter sp. SOSP1-52]GHO72226.1 hypothetical protein KSC_111180 [Ktedonobacter sp. SOSP1-52]